MGWKTGVGGRVGGGRGAGAVGRALDLALKPLPASPPMLATSFEFLRLCLSSGIVKAGANLLFHFSNLSCDKASAESDEMSVRGELCKAIHKKEEEEKSGGRLFSTELVLLRSIGLTQNPRITKDARIKYVMRNNHLLP